MRYGFNSLLAGCFIVCMQMISGAEKGVLLKEESGLVFGVKRIKFFDEKKSLYGDEKKSPYVEDEGSDKEMLFICLGLELMKIGIKQKMSSCKCHPNGGPLVFKPHSDLNDIRNRSGLTFLTIVVACSHKEVKEVIKLLLESGADINRPDGRGITPLQQAILCGNEEVKKFLQDNGARDENVTV